MWCERFHLDLRNVWWVELWPICQSPRIGALWTKQTWTFGLHGRSRAVCFLVRSYFCEWHSHEPYTICLIDQKLVKGQNLVLKSLILRLFWNLKFLKNVNNSAINSDLLNLFGSFRTYLNLWTILSYFLLLFQSINSKLDWKCFSVHDRELRFMSFMRIL